MSQIKNKASFTLGITAFLVVAVFVISFRGSILKPSAPSDEQISTQTNQFDYVNASQLHEKILAGASITLLDIRGEEAFETYHLAGAKEVQIDSIDTVASGLPENQEIVLIGSIEDSQTLFAAANQLKKTGRAFTILSGGVETWQSLALPAFSSGTPTSFIDQTKVKYISPEQVKDFLKGNRPPKLLDVRPGGVFAQSNRSGSINIPLSELEKRKKDIPAFAEIIVYGATPLESFQAGVRLFDLGIYSAKTLDGSYTDIAQ